MVNEISLYYDTRSEKHQTKNELRSKIVKRSTNRVCHTVLPLLKSQSVLIAEKSKFRKTVIRPVATYRAESLTRNKDIAKWLAAFGRKVLRRMSWGIKVNENRRK